MDVAPDGTAKGKPSCRPVQGAEERATFKKPSGASSLRARAKNRTLSLLRNKITLVTWTAAAAIDRVEAVYEGKAGVVVEYRSGGAPGAVGFKLGASPPSPSPSASPSGAAKIEGTWEQRIIPCEQAGVKLELARNKKFKLTLETKCQSGRDRLRLSGTWREEQGALLLTFPQDEGPEETMSCPISKCSGEPCIVCASEDVGFTVLPARRSP